MKNPIPKLKTLIVDDELMSTTILTAMVDKNPFLKLTTAVDRAEKAQIILQSEQIDLVFLDVNMPGTTGLQLLEALGDNKPYIVLISARKEYALDAFDQGVIDYLLKPISPARFNQAVDRVLDNVKKTASSHSFESDLLIKAIRFHYSRGKHHFKTVISKQSKLGYTYPFLAATYGHNLEEKTLQLLEKAEELGYLANSEFKEATYSCPNCHNGFLHYREVCTNCHSSNLKSEDLIHHFPCAHIGPISEFEDPNDSFSMICPKCNKHLKHIGVDYDKPSVIHSCKNCDQIFQDTMVFSKCMTCETDVEVNHLHKSIIYDYEITPKGELGALMGQMKIDESQERLIHGTIDANLAIKESFIKSFWQQSMPQDEDDAKRYVMSLDFEGGKMLFNQIGDQSYKNLLTDITLQIKNSLDLKDFISFPTPYKAVLSFFQDDAKGAYRYALEMKEFIEKLIEDNFNVSVKVHVEYFSIESFEDVTQRLRKMLVV